VKKLWDYVEKERMDEVRREVTDLVRVKRSPVVPFDGGAEPSQEDRQPD
jgi:hypothetical protein